MNIRKESFTIVPMRREHAQALCIWKYDAPYDIYGWLPWEQMEALGVEFGDPRLREEQYVSALDAHGALSGFAQLFPMEGVVRLGIGLRPDLCGNGLGKSFVKAVVATAQKRYPERVVDLEVHTWNKRAIRTYEQSGFEITDTYKKRTPEGDQLFNCMVYKQPSSRQQ